MDRRANTTPMDFEYQNGRGPVDERSGFAQVGMKAQQQRDQTDSGAKKRPFGIFSSPSKTSIPSLREPASQPHFFNRPSEMDIDRKPLPAVPANPSFTTPRKFDVDVASSGGETPNTPETNNDSDATPDNMGFRSAFTKFANTSTPFVPKTSSSSPSKKDRRGSLLGRVLFGQASPGRGEIARGNYSHALEKKIRKKRSRDARMMRRRGSTSDSEDDDRLQTSDQAKADAQVPSPKDPNAPSRLFNLFSFIETHPNLPHILSFYAQLALNIFLVFFFIYIIYSFWSTIRSDVDKKSEEAVAEILAEMAVCAKEYRDNRCEPETRVRAMEVVCGNWEKCMSRDPKSVGRARVSAHTFAEIFNSFVEPISYKAMVFSFIIIFGCVTVSNFAFGLFRDKAAASHMPFAPSYSQPPPPTPHRQFSGHEQPYFTPYQSHVALEPAPSQRYGVIEGAQRSPVRRLEYR